MTETDDQGRDERDGSVPAPARDGVPAFGADLHQGVASADHVPDTVLEELLAAFGPGDVQSDQAVAAVGGVETGGEDRRRIVIAADDLPDAVYLDDESAAIGPHVDGQQAVSGRIVIEDDSFVGESEGKRATGTATGVDPRMRARRIAVRRAEGRKRLRWALGIGLVVVLVVGVLAVLGSPLFDIERVDVEGAVYADAEVVADVVDGLMGEPILTADLRSAEARIEELPWVREARVTMHFPHRVLIEVAERSPLAYFAGADGQFRVIDIDGQVLDVIDGRPVDYVEITGVGPDLDAGADSGGTYRGAAQLVNALPPSVRPRVASLGVTEAGEITMLLDARPTNDGAPVTPIGVVFGEPDDYQEKLVALVNELARHAPGTITSIDVSTGSPIVSPTPTAPAEGSTESVPTGDT